MLLYDAKSTLGVLLFFFSIFCLNSFGEKKKIGDISPSVSFELFVLFLTRIPFLYQEQTVKLKTKLDPDSTVNHTG